MFNFPINQLPVARLIEDGTQWLVDTFSGFFNFVTRTGSSFMDGFTTSLSWIPPILFIAIVVVLSYFANDRKWGLPVFSLVGLGYILNQGLWTDLNNTIALIVVSAVITVIIGIPIGILAAKSDLAESIIKPILDFMQTMPAFVYLIPAVAFFGIGMVPGIFASFIYALAPTVRLTNLGIREIDEELIEASDSFGSTRKQKLFDIELPLAKNTIMAGINQTVMLTLSMVVIASMIGSPGLGSNVLSAVQQSDIGAGFTSGLAIVILAIIVDRLTQALGQNNG
ncbi:MAG: proline/glycine betaine ABC transporter permease, partial [Atopostipes suicloacalis]|nr:proline/glycine betaine ABC transporter permease [Atopostipes suicloacalis]